MLQIDVAWKSIDRPVLQGVEQVARGDLCRTKRFFLEAKNMTTFLLMFSFEKNESNVFFLIWLVRNSTLIWLVTQKSIKTVRFSINRTRCPLNYRQRIYKLEKRSLNEMRRWPEKRQVISIELSTFRANSIIRVKREEKFFFGQNKSANFFRSDWWQGYSKKEANPLYRTTANDYGAEKPNVHTMPTVYRTQSSAFTEVRWVFVRWEKTRWFFFSFSKHLGKCGMYRHRGFNTALDKGRFIDRPWKSSSGNTKKTKFRIFSENFFFFSIKIKSIVALSLLLFEWKVRFLFVDSKSFVRTRKILFLIS